MHILNIVTNEQFYSIRRVWGKKKQRENLLVNAAKIVTLYVFRVGFNVLQVEVPQINLAMIHTFSCRRCICN